MSRYIDAEWLKAEFPHDEDWNYPVNTNSYVVGMIDEAPSIDLADYVPKDFHDKTCEAMAKAHQAEIADILERADADRPQGYWTKTDVATYRCSECGKIQIADDVNELNFCCCCGSRNKVRRMKGADNE